VRCKRLFIHVTSILPQVSNGLYHR
jgi:hypothetical protein